MSDKVTLTEKCIELGTRATDEEDKSAATFRGGGFSEVFKLAVNMLRIGAEETYRSLEALLEHTPAIRDELEMDEYEMIHYLLQQASSKSSNDYYRIRPGRKYTHLEQ